MIQKSRRRFDNGVQAQLRINAIRLDCTTNANGDVVYTNALHAAKHIPFLLQQLDSANQTIVHLCEEKARLDELTADLAAERDELINEVARHTAVIERLLQHL